MARNMLGEGVVKMIIPPRQCFWMFPRVDGYFQPTCFNKATDCTCYDFVRNWTGLMAGVTLLLIGLSSLNYVRRTLYNVFYKIHIIAGPTMLLLVILHWNRSILFLAGSALYYTACSFPVVWEQQRNKKRGGVRIVSVERIQSLQDHDYSRPCIAVTVEASDLALQQFRAGQYVQLKAPAVSDISHPFTINTVPRNSRQMQIIFRCVGPFTRQLAENFIWSDVAGTCNAEDEEQVERHMPELYLDGFHGSPNRMREVFKHDVVVIVAGGIGITPYLSLLQRVHGFATTYNSTMTRQLILQWSCRDPDLIDFVKREYFDVLLSEAATSPAAKLRIQIVIHKTTGSDMTTAMLHADSESPKLNQWDNFSCNRESSLLYVPPQEQRSVAFSPSRWGPKNTCRENLVSFVSSLLTTTAGLAGILYSYFQLQSKTTTLPRLVGPLFVLLLGMFVACISNEVSRRFGFGPESLQSAEFEPLDAVECDDEVHLPKETTVELREASSFRLQNQVTSGLVQHHPKTRTARDGSCVLPESDEAMPFVELEERTGRASLHDFLNTLESAERPGLFSCGPLALMADLRDVTQQRCVLRLQRCATDNKAPIALYEESFEM